MEKLSSDKVASIIGQVGPALRALSLEKIALQEKVAFYERRDRATKLASEMTRKNLDPDSTMDQKVENLMSPETDLDVVEKAVDLSAQQMKLASVSDNPSDTSDALSGLERAIMGDDQ